MPTDRPLNVVVRLNLARWASWGLVLYLVLLITLNRWLKTAIKLMAPPVNALSVPAQTVIDADICIIGAGPAGITLAKQLSGTAAKVVLLESGGEHFDADLQTLNEGQVTTHNFEPLQFTRRRQFGGTANAWTVNYGTATNNREGFQTGVRYVPLDATDFLPRDDLARPGWPIAYDDLVSYYTRAHNFCQLGPFDYREERWRTQDIYGFPWPDTNLQNAVFQIGDRRVFLETYRQDIYNTPNVTPYLQGNAVELCMDDAAQKVTTVNVACRNGNQFAIAAKFVVLATGCIEAVRLLLSSQAQQPEGIGNAYGLVGRYFMDHYLVDFGSLVLRHPHLWQQTKLYDVNQIHDTYVMGRLALSADAMRDHSLLNTSMMLFPRTKTFRSKLIRSIKGMRYFSPSRQSFAKVVTRLPQVMKELDHPLISTYQKMTNSYPTNYHLGKAGWANSPNLKRHYTQMELLAQVEQLPRWHNRIVLTADRDALGMRRVALDWHVDPQEVDAIRRLRHLLEQTVARSHLGQIDTGIDYEFPRIHMPGGVHHHLGVTRMSAYAQTGVVDVNCRVHTTRNLFVASGAVFPSGGYANPTLTIIALAIRLADHLKRLI